MIGNIENTGVVETKSTAVNTVRNNRRAEYLPDESEESFTDLDSLKSRFCKALTARAKADKPLFEVVGEMIAADVERDEAIEWGMETGLSESYVRTTVSRLYSDVDGGKNAKGQGRKSKPEAQVIYDYAVRLYGADRATIICRGASRIGEKVDRALKQSKGNKPSDKPAMKKAA
jgi:hypothetical protein